ncbi:MAG: protein-tyrosine-phosphatase [Myxococcota bacterium]|jgi:protein-tyrosine-phosphatase
MDETRPYHLLFVCTANICRSPMAEGLALEYAQQRGWSVECQSGGIMGLIDKDAASNAVRALREINIDISDHKSQGITPELVEWADHILVMELRHAIKLRERHDNLGTKVLQLGSFGGLVEVDDPVGGWRWRFRRSRDDIQRCVQAFMDNLPPRLR